MDGHPRFAIAPGERYVYEFTVDNRAGSYWFHPHPHGRTGKQVYAGLAGLFLVSDDEEAALGLPSGAQDLPLVIQDRNLDADNQFVYLDGARAGAPARGMRPWRHDGRPDDGRRHGLDDGRHDGCAGRPDPRQRQPAAGLAGRTTRLSPAPAERIEHAHATSWPGATARR